MSLVVARSLSKTYATDSVEVRAVQGVSFEIKAGAFLCFVGPSGSGKTTLLNLIGCLDKPSSVALMLPEWMSAGSTGAPRLSKEWSGA